MSEIIDDMDIEKIDYEIDSVIDALTRYAMYGKETNMDREETKLYEKEVAALQDHLEALSTRKREILSEQG